MNCSYMDISATVKRVSIVLNISLPRIDLKKTQFLTALLSLWKTQFCSNSDVSLSFYTFSCWFLRRLVNVSSIMCLTESAISYVIRRLLAESSWFDMKTFYDSDNAQRPTMYNYMNIYNICMYPISFIFTSFFYIFGPTYEIKLGRLWIFFWNWEAPNY